MKIYLYPIYDSRKDFYKKAYIIKYDDKIELYSYDTLVLTLYNNYYQLNLEIEEKKLFSNTTLRHIKEFINQFTYGNTNKLQTKKDIIKYNNFQFDVLMNR